MIEIKSKNLQAIIGRKTIMIPGGRKNGRDEAGRIIVESIAYVEWLESENERLTKLLAKVGDGN